MRRRMWKRRILLSTFLMLAGANRNAEANGSHHLKPAAAEFVGLVMAEKLEAARRKVEPYERIRRHISLSEAEYRQRLNALLSKPRLSATIRLTEVVIEDVSWNPSSKQTFACVKLIFSEPVTDEWKLPLCFHLDQGWQVVGMSSL